jgi:hypothetical protein
MRASDIPSKVTVPWATFASTDTYRPIPVPSQIAIQPGAASFTDGFPPLNFIDTDVGGVPPWGKDMNGILNLVTQWNRWTAAGGLAIYDATFSAAVGGYPNGAVVLAPDGRALYQCIVDNNTNDPTTSGVGWRVLASPWSIVAWQAAGSANVQTITLSPVPVSLAALVGVPITFRSIGTNSGAVTLTVNGTGVMPVLNAGGNALAVGQITSGTFCLGVYNGGYFQLLSPAPPIPVPPPGRLLNVRAFGTPGTITYVPTAGTGSIEVEAVGAGAGAGGALPAGTGNCAAGHPGGGGAYGRSRFTTGFAGVNIVVGQGGVGVTGGSGADGGVSLFWTMSCPGGKGGSVSTVLPGNASGGNGNRSGLPTGANLLAAEGGTGGVCFGIVGTQVGIGGSGGDSYFGGGATGQTINADGNFANTPGSGGGGNINVEGNSALRGGNGANGLVIIREFSA